MKYPARIAIAICSLAAAPRVDANVVINEIMYNSPGGTDVEFVELLNHGATPRDLTGWYLLDDNDTHDRCYLSGTLGSEQMLVVAGTLSLFQTTYPGVTNLNADDFESPTPGAGFALGNAADEVRLYDATGTLVDFVAYQDTSPWPSAADGNGSSLELVNPGQNNAVASSWSASVSGPPGGTPGATNSVYAADLPPSIGAVVRSVAFPTSADSVTFTAQVFDDVTLTAVDLFVDTGSGFVQQPMLDDGAHGDGPPGDAVYGAVVPPHSDGTIVRSYVSASDSLFQVTLEPAEAPLVYLGYTVGYLPPSLRITEILASNQSGAVDELGEPEDWIEIHDPGPLTVALGGMFLSDVAGDPRRWPIPAVSLPPGGYLRVWCDGETVQGPLHASFNLPKEGGFVGLFDSLDHGNTLLSGMSYGPQLEDVAFGFFPNDGSVPDYLSTPTPGASNDGAGPFSPICINEFLAASDLGTADWIELYNRGGAAIDLTGWHISDTLTDLARYTFPPGSSIEPSDFVSVDQTQLGFGLDQNGSEILVLTNAIGAARDFFDYGPQLADRSQGRLPDGSGTWQTFPQPTRDLPNSCAGGPALGAVTGLALASKTALTWNALGQAQHYDVVKGSLATLRASAGNFTGAVLGCLENAGTDTASWDGAVPSAGLGFFYVVRGTTAACGIGTFDGASPPQIGSRDAEIAAAAVPCP